MSFLPPPMPPWGQLTLPCPTPTAPPTAFRGPPPLQERLADKVVQAKVKVSKGTSTLKGKAKAALKKKSRVNGQNEDPNLAAGPHATRGGSASRGSMAVVRAF